MKHRLPCCILLAVCALAARADTPPQRLLEEGRSQMASARTLSADMVLVLDDGENATAQLRLMKPNLVSLRIKNRRGDTRIYCDGREGYLVIPGKKRYVRTALDGKGRSLPTAASVFPLVAAFVSPDVIDTAAPARLLGKMGVATAVGHEEYSGVELEGPAAEKVWRWYFNEGGLPAGAVLKEGSLRSLWLQNVKLGVPMKASEFAYRPPAGFKPLELQGLSL